MGRAPNPYEPPAADARLSSDLDGGYTRRPCLRYIMFVFLVVLVQTGATAFGWEIWLISTPISCVVDGRLLDLHNILVGTSFISAFTLVLGASVFWSRGVRTRWYGTLAVPDVVTIALWGKYLEMQLTTVTRGKEYLYGLVLLMTALAIAKLVLILLLIRSRHKWAIAIM